MKNKTKTTQDLPIRSVEPLRSVLQKRETQYGNFAVQGHIAQNIRVSIRNNLGWNRLAPDQKEALDMIANKLSRVLNGNPDVIDHWEDIAGYAMLVVYRLKGETL
jgi:hypothetical protein